MTELVPVFVFPKIIRRIEVVWFFTLKFEVHLHRVVFPLVVDLLDASVNPDVCSFVFDFANTTSLSGALVKVILVKELLVKRGVAELEPLIHHARVIPVVTLLEKVVTAIATRKLVVARGWAVHEV